jgi:bile acid-coenzyme A ligase
MLQRIADLPGIDGRDLSSIVWVLQGAAVIPPSLVHRWIALIGADRFYMAYGMTEGLGLTALRADEWLAHPGSVGRGYREMSIKYVDVAPH